VSTMLQPSQSYSTTDIPSNADENGNITISGYWVYCRTVVPAMPVAVSDECSSTTSVQCSRYDQIMPLLHRLHWLRSPRRISFKLAVLAFRCLRGLAPTYLSDSLRHVADLPNRQRLRSASSADLAVPKTRLQTVSDRAFCVAPAKTWNSLPSEMTSSATLSTFKHNLFSLSFPGM